jgi:hypothetical protein
MEYIFYFIVMELDTFIVYSKFESYIILHDFSRPCNVICVVVQIQSAVVTFKSPHCLNERICFIHVKEQAHSTQRNF